MSNIKLEVKGFKELARDIRELSAKVQKKVLRKSIKEAAKVVAEAAKQKVPVKTGALRESIKVTTSSREPYTETASVKVRQFYGKFIEFGWMPRIGKKKGESRSERRARAKKRGVTAKARPFLRPAFDENAEKIGNDILQNVGKEIEKAFK